VTDMQVVQFLVVELQSPSPLPGLAMLTGSLDSEDH